MLLGNSDTDVLALSLGVVVLLGPSHVELLWRLDNLPGLYDRLLGVEQRVSVDHLDKWLHATHHSWLVHVILDDLLFLVGLWLARPQLLLLVSWFV